MTPAGGHGSRLAPLRGLAGMTADRGDADERQDQTRWIRPRRQGRGRRQHEGRRQARRRAHRAGRQGRRRRRGPKTITFTLDGEEVHARAGETIWQVAKRHGTDIPHLCYAPEPGYRPDGNCRACMVEIEGERVLAASCIRTPSPGMKVKIGLRSRQDRAQNGVRAADRGPARPQHAGARSGVEVLGLGRPHGDRHEPPAARARRSPRRTAAMSRWRSISTPASSAISASAPAARCRSTT